MMNLVSIIRRWCIYYDFCVFIFSLLLLAILLILCLQEIEANEKRKCQLQDMIEEAITNNGNQTYLRILSQYRLLVNHCYFYIFLC